MTLGLSLLNQLIDSWNVTDKKLYKQAFNDYTLTPNLNPHTIGPTGTFVVASRPVQLDYCTIALNTSSPTVYTECTVRDERWYRANPIPGLTNTLPTNVYYAPTWPNGQLYFWGVPTVAYGVRLWTRLILAGVVQTDTFSLPPGYQRALRLTLAEEIANSLGQAVSQTLMLHGKQARADIFDNNEDAPPLRTRDAGVPGRRGTGNRSNFNWMTRMPN